MKRFLTLILLLLSFLLARHGVMAQSNATPPTGVPNKPFMNIPINVCAGNFASINAFIWDSTYYQNGNRQFNYPNVKVDWTITGGDYAVLYNGKPNLPNGTRDTTITNQAADSYKVNALTIRFNTPGVVYTVKADITYKDYWGNTRTTSITRTITSVDCSITVCKGNTTMASDFYEDFGRFRRYTDNSLSDKPKPYWIAGAVGYNYNNNIFYSWPNPDINGDFSDNSYAIYWNTKLRGEWDSVGDHTGNIRYISPTSDSVGGMLVANSANDKRIFYTRDVTVCPGSQYNFSAWFLNTNTREVFNKTCVQGNPTGYRYAGVTFKILDSLGNLLKEFKTFDVSMNLNTSGERWLQYGGTFKVPGGIKKLKLQIVNDNEGGCGNDIAIDDIKFNYCSPNIYGFVDGLKDDGVTESVQCAGSPIDLTAWYTPNGYDPNDPSKPYNKDLDYFSQKVFRWEYSYNLVNWYTLTDSIGVNTATGVTEKIRYGSQDSILHFLPGALQGNPTQPVVRYYRLNIFEKGNENIKDCGSPSTPIAITILPKPVVKLSSAAICLGDQVNLTVEGQYTRYEWKAPPEIAGISNEAVVVSPTHSTTYTAYGYANYGNGRSCVDSGSATIRVDTPAVVHVTGGPLEICAGQTPTSFQIEPENNKYSIKWTSTWPVAQDTVYGSTTNVLSNIYPWHVGDNYFKATVTKGVCVTSDSLLVQVRSMPIAKTNMDEMVGQCNKSQFTMKANQPLSDQKGTWTFIRGVSNGTSTITNPNLYNTTVNISPAGTRDTLIWTVVNNNKADCISRDTVILFNTKPLTVPKSMGSTQVCVLAGESVVLNLNGTKPENEGEYGKWTSNPVTNITFANDALYNTTATIVGTGAATNYTLYWTINNGICPAGPSASLAVRTKTPPTVAITNSPVIACNTAPSVRLNITSGSSTITNYSIASTGANPMPNFVPVTAAAWTGASYIDMNIPANTPAGIYTFVMTVWERNTTTGEDLAGCTKAVTFTVNLSEPATPPTDITVNGAALCGSGNVLLTLNGAKPGTNPDSTVATVWKWYKGSCGGTPVTPDSANADNSVVLFRNVTATTTYYVRGESSGPCGNSICKSVTVTVYQKPGVPTATPEQTHCNVSTFTMDASNPVPATAGGKWSIIGGNAAGVVITDPANPKTTVTVPAGNWVELKWAVGNGVCDSVSTTVKLYNYAAAEVADAGADQSACEKRDPFKLGASELTGTGNLPQVGTWTVLYNGTATPAPSVSNVNDPAATITVPVGDSIRLVWTVSSGKCSFTTDTVALYNFAASAAANAGNDQTACAQTDPFQLGATPVKATGNIQQIGTWTVIYNGTNPTPVVVGDHNPNATIKVPVGDSVRLVWTVTSTVGGNVNTTCDATTDTLVIYNYAKNVNVAAGADLSACAQTTPFQLAATPVQQVGNIQQVGTWTVIYTGTNTTPQVVDPHDPATTITVPVGDSVRLVWTITSVVDGKNVASCFVQDTMAIYNYAANAAAVAGEDQSACAQITPFKLTATPVEGAGNIQQVGTWTVIYTGSGTAPQVANAHDPATTITVPVGDSVRLVWTVTSFVNGQAVTKCDATTDTVAIYNYAANAAAVAGEDQSACAQTAPFKLTATPVEGAGNIQQVGTWTVIYTGKNATPQVANAHDPATTITVPVGDSVRLVWTVTSFVNGQAVTKCAATTDTVAIYNYAANAAAVAGEDQSACAQTAPFTLTATPVTGPGNIQQVGTWTVIYTGKNATPQVADAHYPATTITVPVGDSVRLVWTVTSFVNGQVITECAATTDTVAIYNYAQNVAAVAGEDQNGCAQTTPFKLGATPVTGTGNIQQVGTWTVIYTGTNTTPQVADTHDPATTIVVPVGDSVRLVWTVTSFVNGQVITQCAAATDTVAIYNYAASVTAVAGGDQEACAQKTPFKLTATPVAQTGNIQQTGTWIVNYNGTNPTPTVSDIHDPHATILVPVGDSVTLVWSVATTNGTCAASTDTMIIRNYAIAAKANAGKDLTDCNRTTDFTLEADEPTPATASGIWTIIKGNATIRDKFLHNSGVYVAPGDTVTLRWTITNGTCASTEDEMTIINYLKPVPAVAGPNREHCDVDTFHLHASDPGVAGAIGTWIVTGGDKTKVSISSINDKDAIVTVEAGQTVQLTWVVSNGVCDATSSSLTLINRKPILGNTISADQTLCLSETAKALTGGALTGGDGTYSYQWQSSTTGANGPFANINGATNDSYQPGALTQNTWYRRLVTSGQCIDNISNVVSIVVITKPPFVVTTPPSFTTECVLNKDYTTMFGKPEFSHAPYTNEQLQITWNDASVTVNACTRTITRTWTATDRCGTSVKTSQTITIVDTKAPVFTTPAPRDTTVDCDKVPGFVNLTAKDDCGGDINIAPVETRKDIPGNCGNSYQLIRTWTAKDACNTGATLTQVITVVDRTAPVFNVPTPANVTVDCDKIPAGQPLTATDNCTPGVITAQPKDSIVRKPGDCQSKYLIYRKWTALDECGNGNTTVQIITVQDTTKPVFSMPAPKDTVVDCDKLPGWPVISATDNCTGSVQVITSSKIVKIPGSCAGNYIEIRTWTATDACNNVATMQQRVTVQDTVKPVFTILPPADTTVSCDAIPAPAPNVTATDNCSTGNEVKLIRTITTERIPGACNNSYRIIRTWTAMDACANKTEVRQVITVVDTTRPVIAPAPADIEIYCQDKIPSSPTLIATDNCDPSFPKKVTYTEDPYVKDICNGYTIIRRWSITDACGNKSNDVIQRIIIKPCDKPKLNANLPQNCSDNPRIVLQAVGSVTRPTYTLVGITPSNAVNGLPITQSSNIFNLNGATSASFIITDGRTGCSSDTVTYDLKYTQKPVVNLGKDTTICGGNSLVLDAGAANFGYNIRWSTGETTQRINITKAGTYWVNVSNGQCGTTDTIKVGLIPTPLVDIPDTTICRGQSVKLDAFVNGATYLWSTGATSSSILVGTQEQFWVKVTKSGCITIDTVKVSVNPPPDISLSRDTTICPDQSIMLTVNSNGGRIQWQTGETGNSIVVNKPGNYWVAVSRDNCVVRDTVNVRMKPTIKVDLGPDRNICPGAAITLDGTTENAISYLWNDGDPNPVKKITAAGNYKIAVMDQFCQRVFMDSVKVNVTGLPKVNLGNDTVMCKGETLTLRAFGSGITAVRWDNGSSAPTLNVTEGGTYTVTVFNDCGSATDQIRVDFTQCEPKPELPNAFSPNGDGRNDVFRPVVRGPMYEYELRIFNRWGELIFMSSDQHRGWDGKHRGVPVEVGTYVWWLTYKKYAGGMPNVLKGEVTVIR